ncbi:MAG: LPS export ABC transporter ATP-binding protein [bacterium]
MSCLTVESISKQFHGRTVVNGLSLQVNEGEVVGLLGPNGAGKTTAFYMIVGLIPVDDGDIHILDHRATGLPMHERAKRGLSYLAQEPSIFRRLTVEENVLAVLELRSELNRNERLERCDQLLHELNIRHLAKQAAVSLSGGERRRLEIARALAVEPRIVLLDEPFAGVDPISVVDIQEIIRQLADRNIAILITDHNVRETLGICERAYIVTEGSVLAQGTPEEIMADEAVRNAYLGENFRL